MCVLLNQVPKNSLIFRFCRELYQSQIGFLESFHFYAVWLQLEALRITCIIPIIFIIHIIIYC